MIWKLSNQSGRYGTFRPRARVLVGALALALFASLPGAAQVAPTPNIANTPLGEVNTEGLRPTYFQCATATITGNGDFVILQGSATKTIRVTQVTFEGQATAATGVFVTLFRRSTGPTGGTTGGATALAKADINDPAPTATFTSYTTPPTAGTSAGIIKFRLASIAAVGSVAPPVIFEFAQRAEESIVLRKTTDYLAVVNNNSGAGNTGNVCLTWIEE